MDNEDEGNDEFIVDTWWSMRQVVSGSPIIAVKWTNHELKGYSRVAKVSALITKKRVSNHFKLLTHIPLYINLL